MASCISAAVSAPEMPLACTENWTDAKAMCPSREICPGVEYGLATWLTPFACANGASAAVTRLRTAGSPIGRADRMARVRVSPDWR